MLTMRNEKFHSLPRCISIATEIVQLFFLPTLGRKDCAADYGDSAIRQIFRQLCTRESIGVAPEKKLSRIMVCSKYLLTDYSAFKKMQINELINASNSH